MEINETVVSEAIIRTYEERLLAALQSTVAVVGGGPAGLMAALRLAAKGIKTTLFERRLSLGGGMWGGGIGRNVIVVQEAAQRILAEIGIKHRAYAPGYYVADSIESVCKLGAAAKDAGAEILNLFSVEDVLCVENEVRGLVITRTPIEQAGLHVDPIAVSSQFIVDATGHAAEVARIIERKVGPLRTASGSALGEKAMAAEAGEQFVVEKTGEVYPRVYVAGMAVGAVLGGPRMGPIFGGMLLSGERVAELIAARLACSASSKPAGTA
ncbi:MAG: sulfide-dependent adenosine diphosphate thiazole synthase [candidate division KSB1 bacterium]|nr:sulfide-dependent adenosine diphosphate thiazole synthase [candidate division KSB1 bacterium]